jgi:ABC-type amino acid transport substrate-binding protein
LCPPRLGTRSSLSSGTGATSSRAVHRTDARRKLIDFTAEVFPTGTWSRHKPHALRSVEALPGERLGVVKGTSLADSLAALGVSSADIDDQIPSGGTLAALKSGRITCTVDEVAGAIMSQRQDPNLELGLFLGPPGSYAYGVRKEDVHLRAALDEYIENLRRTPTWNRLVVKYFGADAPEILRKARTQ